MKLRFEKYILCILTFAAVFISCKDDRVFEETPTVRILNELKAYGELLKNDGGVWRVEYKPLHADSTVFILKFENDADVQMFENNKESISTFSLNYGQGPTLSFDTYSILHYYSDPDQFNNDVTMGGDYEFVLHERTDNRIVAVGKKNRTSFVMTRVTSGEENKVRLMNIVNPDYKLKYGTVPGFFYTLKSASGDFVDVIAGADENHLLVTGAAGTTTVEVSYTASGFTLSPAVSLGGIQVSSFEWNENTKAFVEANGVVFASVNIPKYISGETAGQLIGNYYDLDVYSPSVKSMISKLLGEFGTLNLIQCYIDYKESLTDEGGVVQEKILSGLVFALNEGESYNWNCYGTKSYNVIGGNTITFAKGIRVGDKMGSIFKNEGGKNFCNSFFNDKGQTIIERNGKIYMVSRSDSKNWMVLKPGTIKYPLF